MIVVYNKEGFREIKKSDISKIEIENRNLPKENRLIILECEDFPPFGKKLEEGELVDKNEKERVESGEVSISDTKNKIIEKINSACNSAIISGFESSALGEIHIYDSEDIDQLNLIGAVASSKDVLYKCSRKSDSKRDFYSHTNSQMKKVLNDAATRKIALLQKCFSLKQELLLLDEYDLVANFKIDMELV